MIGTRLTAQGVQDYWRRIVDECSREIAELPNNPLRYYKRAQAYKELGNLELALGDLTRVIDLKSDDPKAYILRAGIHRQLKQNRRVIFTPHQVF